MSLQTVERILAQKNDAQPRQTVLKPVARVMDRKVISAAVAEVMRDKLAQFIDKVYEETSTGAYWNIGEDGRILPPLKPPWTDRGRHEYGVRHTIQRIMQHTMRRVNNGPFVFGSDTCWYVNLEQYPTADSALNWLERVELDGEMWNVLHDRWKNRAKSRASRAQGHGQNGAAPRDKQRNQPRANQRAAAPVRARGQ